MNFKNILPVNVSYDDKIKGQLIDPYEWNNNFHVLENVITENSEKLNENFKTLSEITGVSSIGTTNLFNGTEDISTLENQLLLIISRLLSTYTIGELDAKFTSVDAKTVNRIEYNNNDGCFTVFNNDGSKTVIDTNIEKIPVSVKLEEVGGRVKLIITNYDGTTTSADISDFLNLYESADSDTIQILWNDNSFTASVRNASIKYEHLANDAVKALEDAVSSASGSAQNAATYAWQAAQSAVDAEEQAKLARSYADGVGGVRPEEATDNAKYYSIKAGESREIAENKANDAMNYSIDSQNHSNASEQYAKTSRSYAIGGTGSRDGEDTDNAKYYASIAKDVAGGDFITPTELPTILEEVLQPFLTQDIDCGGFIEVAVAQHEGDENAHANMLADGNSTEVNTAATTLDEHESDANAHSNMLLDGNTY